MGLKGKQVLFVAEYLKDLNATCAAIRSGYSEKTANQIGPALLVNTGVREAIQKALGERIKETKIDANYVLNRLVEIDKMDVLDILNEEGRTKPISEWPPVWRQFISGIDISEEFSGVGQERITSGLLKKIKWPDKVRNLELLGKHVNVGAFRENISHTGAGDGPMRHEITEKSKAEVREEVKIADGKY